MQDTLIIRELGQRDYEISWRAMQHFTQTRQEHTLDEIWLTEHFPVFTQGQNGEDKHVRMPGGIPIIRVDRGGQVTYHGPGQWVVYTLINLQRKQWNVRELVTRLENTVISFLSHYHIDACAKSSAPGVYINDCKVCSIGLRIRRGCSFHGFAINIAMDMEPFSRIHPCGFEALQMTQLTDHVSEIPLNDLRQQLICCIMHHLEYTHCLMQLENPHGT